MSTLALVARADRRITLVWITAIWAFVLFGFGADFARFLGEHPAPAPILLLHGAFSVTWLGLVSTQVVLAETYPHRLAAGERPDSFDKDVIRAWVAARCDPYKDDIPEIPPELIWKTALTYVEAHNRITGRTFEPPSPAPPVGERVLAALGDFRGPG